MRRVWSRQPVEHKVLVASGQNHLAHAQFPSDAGFDRDNVAGPKGGQHAFATNFAVEASRSGMTRVKRPAQHFSDQSRAHLIPIRGGAVRFAGTIQEVLVEN
jgi:hypothetical protein